MLGQIFPPEVMERIKPVWGVDEEGEQHNVWRDSGVPNFWFMMGNLMWCRFHSKHVALRESSLLFIVLRSRRGLGADFACRDQGDRRRHPSE